MPHIESVTDLEDTKTRRISFFLPSLAGGGAEKVFVDLANEYTRTGHAVTMICANAVGPFVKALDPRVQVVDLKARRVLYAIPAVYRFLRTHDTDIIVSAMLHANIGLLIAARVLQRHPARVIVQDVAPLSGTIGTGPGLFRTLMKRLYPRADLCLAISDNIAEEVRQAVGWVPGSHHVTVLPNPVVLKAVNRVSDTTVDHPWLREKECPVILAVGRLSPEKDFPTLLRAFARARGQRAMKLIILGEGPERAALEDLANELGIEDDFDMPGFVDRPYEFMAQADLICVSSRFEGFSLVILEALSTGVSIVMTNCGDGPMTMVDDGRLAEVVDIADEQQMAAGILKRLRDPFAPEDLKRQALQYDVVTLAKRYLKTFLIGGFSANKCPKTSKHICFFLPDLAGGGAERLVVDLANFHAEHDGRSTIICGKAAGPYLPYVEKEVEIVEVGHRRVLMNLIALKRVVHRRAPDAVVANMSHANVVLILAGLLPPRFRCRVVVQEVAQLYAGRMDLHPIRDRAVLYMMRWIYPYADQVLAISRSIAQELENITTQPSLNVETLPGLIDSVAIERKKMEPVSHPWFGDDSVDVIIAIGRLSPEKDFQTLMSGFKAVRETRSSVRLMILGEGRLRDELEKLSRELGIDDDVHMPGFVENPFAYLSKSDLFVLSSSAEGFGLVVAEALACGCNVVVTRCSQGPIDIVDDGQYGAVIDIGDEAGMAEAIAQRLDHPIDGDVLIGRGQRYGIASVGQRYIDLILGKHHGELNSNV